MLHELGTLQSSLIAWLPSLKYHPKVLLRVSRSHYRGFRLEALFRERLYLHRNKYYEHKYSEDSGMSAGRVARVVSADSG